MCLLCTKVPLDAASGSRLTAISNPPLSSRPEHLLQALLPLALLRYAQGEELCSACVSQDLGRRTLHSVTALLSVAAKASRKLQGFT